ncbi:MAG: hypothetical protein QOI19_219 [Thermoleophilaceae bacterium]|jgi:hypothetical protein|nr:hypothetical protein [Thermoleophilaceae bacterium]
MPSDNRPYTLIRTLSSQLLACGEFRDLNAQFVAAVGSAASEDYVPVEVEVVRPWVEYREGGDPVGRVLIPGPEPHLETWILNVATVETLAPVKVG